MTYETNSQPLDSGGLLRLDIAYCDLRLGWLGCRLVAPHFFRLPANVLSFRGGSYVPDAA